MHIRGMRLALPIVSALLILFAATVLAPSGRAEAPPGEYRCVKVEVAGQSSSCQSPPLVLNDDGSYRIWGEYGTYEVVQGRWLVLSHSKRRGLGYLEGRSEIVFHYRVGDRTCRVTFRRVSQPTPGLTYS